jgi:peptide/nickel transport system permease protein
VGAYVARRGLQAVPVLLVMSFILYGALNLMPGDPLYRMLRDIPNATPDDYIRLRGLYGLDDPFWLRYMKWLWLFARGQPGYSLQYNVPVMDLVGPRFFNTLLLSVSALVIGKTIAIVVGAQAAVRQYSLFDYASMALAFVGYSIPGFWLGLMVIVLFAVNLQWLPASGAADPRTAPGLLPTVVDRLQHLVLPILVLTFSETTSTARYMRSSLLDVLNQEYLTVARAKGLREHAIVWRHAMKNALIPVVTTIATAVPRVVGGSAVIETVFGYPGMGKLLFDSIMANDFTVVMVILMILATIVVAFNLLADVLYGVLDPRIAYT